MIALNAAGLPRVAQLARSVAGEVQALWAQVMTAASGEAAEQMALAWSRKLGQRVLQAGLQVRAETAQAQAERQCECGNRRHAHSQRSRTVLTRLGPVRVVRQYLRCQGCGARSFPADEWLGWKHGFSRHLEEAVAQQAAALPYRQALTSLRRLCAIEVSLRAAQRIVGRWGAAELTPEPYAQRVKGRMVAEIDGTTTHLEDGWREIKVATFMGWRQGKPRAVTYIADWLPAQEFEEPLYREALVRGAPTAQATAVVADGAPWIWETATTMLSRPTQILDG
ncbi:MAG TPA: hypothetical protein VM221_04145 [Armatimonadota bacterium]|nr:hypothetical protein [Armatimonadota bacterium]